MKVKFSFLLVSIGTFIITIFNGSFIQHPKIEYPILFVSRQIPCCGSVYMKEANALPGVGNFSKYQVAAPGHLCILNPDGRIDTLINGSNPTNVSLNLIDVSAPSLSWDAKSVVFAGLVNGNYTLGNSNSLPIEHNAWRIYEIEVSGKNLKKITGIPNIPESDPRLDLSQFRLSSQNGPLAGYDDTDPIYLPDGRICFSSTRYPGFAMYNAGRSSNLFVVNSDGTDLHRITSEKNGADRPCIDPLSGKIVFSRWWRNFYWPYDGMETQRSPQYPEGYLFKDGLTSNLSYVIDQQLYMFNNNSFLLTEINPDGTDLKIFSMHFREISENSCYGGTFDFDGNYVGNWFPIEHSSESSGFGGIKKYFRNGTKSPKGIIGTYSYGSLDYFKTNPTSYGILKGEYAAEPFVMDEGNILVSIAADPNQDYGIYLINSEGKNRQKIIDNSGTTELRAQVIKPRATPKIIPDRNSNRAKPLPPKNEKELFQEGTFVFDCQNIFFNAPVDHQSVSAPKIGEVSSVRFFAAPSREQQHGSVEALDYPWMYSELPVDEFGRVLNTKSPANLPLFEQARSSTILGYKIPRTGGGIMDGAAHVTGLNFGRPGENVKCVGCHAGHSAIPVPEKVEDLLFTNLAPGARIKASTAMANPGYAIDRKNKSSNSFWFTPEGVDPNGQKLELSWLVPLYAKAIRFHNIPDTKRLTVNECIVRIYSDSSRLQKIKEFIINNDLSPNGTEIPFDNITQMQSMSLEFKKVTGGIYHWNCASIGDIEVIASPIPPDRFNEIVDCKGNVYGEYKVDTCGRCLHRDDPQFNHCLTLIESKKNSKDILVFPNPVSEELHLKWNHIEKIQRISITDLSGNEIYNIELSQRDQFYFIDVRNWSRGVYRITIYSNSHKTYQGKFVKI